MPNKHVRAAAEGMPKETSLSGALARTLRNCQDADIDTQLTELAAQFKLDAMAIDPSITGIWLGRDLGIEGRDQAVVSIYLERDALPFIRRRKA